MLSVSQPLRSVGILLLSPVLRALHHTRTPRSVLCSNAIPSDIQHYGNRHFKRSQTNGNKTNSNPDLLGIFILYFRARFFLEAPFAEVLSGLLWTAYWPLVFLFSPIFGVVLARSFFPHFSIMDSKTVQRSALCRSRRELFNAYFLAKIGVDTAENEPLEVWGENSIQYSLHSLQTTGHSFPSEARTKSSRRKEF